MHHRFYLIFTIFYIHFFVQLYNSHTAKMIMMQVQGIWPQIRLKCSNVRSCFRGTLDSFLPNQAHNRKFNCPQTIGLTNTAHRRGHYKRNHPERSITTKEITILSQSWILNKSEQNKWTCYRWVQKWVLYIVDFLLSFSCHVLDTNQILSVLRRRRLC